MKTKIPPPVVTLVSALLIFFSKELFPSYAFDYQSMLSIGVFISGLMILVSAVSLFKKKETTVNPMSPEKASSLVVDGVFKYTRNPMYLGMSVVLLSISIQFNLIGGLLIVCLFVAYITIFQIIPEEEAMEENFGEEYLSFKKSTRRWI
tara:strand:- start:726 stop:1172 length:447 start_codon:yes stop_codon:yes gene_type:complete